MGSGFSVPDGVHVVIVGAGYGGCQLATKLQYYQAKFTLIDARDVFHHNVATPRALSIPGFAGKTLIPLKETFGDRFKKGLVKSVDSKNKTVKLEDGEEISYDILVLATGTKGSFPCKFENEQRDEVLDMYDKYAQKVKNSQRVVIVGGGAVGVEVAAEIATEYPDKEVTIIHPHKMLVFREDSSDKFQNRLKQVLGNLKVKILYEEKVANLDALINAGAGTVQTTRGTSLDADVVIPCTGLKVESLAYKSSLVGAIDERGALKVNDYFQVEGEEDIFAIGDCCAIGDPWLAYKAEEHADCVLKNISRKAQKQELTKYARKSTTAGGLIVVGLGRNNTIGQMDSGYMIPEFIARRVKSDMFVSKYWKMMNQTVPK